MTGDALPRSVYRRWRKLDKKAAGLGLLGIMYLQEASKVAIVRLTPISVWWGDLLAYALVGAVLVVWYLFREVDLEDAKESADEVAESASDVVDEVTEGDD